MDFQLQRLILIDSFSPGRVVLFPVTGGAVLTGRNGSGKTSLLQLIPVFFGENPNRIVGTETNRLNFVGYYLPRITSYIIYEYRRRDVVCMAVLNSSESGEEIRYRFIRSGYRPELFLLPDAKSIVSARDLYAHAKRKGVICTEQIASISEYRSIIQGKVGSGRDRQKQRGLIADFSFVGGGHHLTHIEKIVSGMFLRRTNFDDLQRMVVSCIAEEKNQIALSAERRKIESWPEHYEAYRAVMQESVRMATVDGLESKLIAAEGELGKVHARGLRLLAHIEGAIRSNRHARQQTVETVGKEEIEFKRQVNQLDQALGEARRDAEDKEARVRRLDAQQADYAQRNLAAKAGLLEKEPALAAERSQLETRKAAVLGKQEDIALQYARLLNDLARAYNEDVARAATRINNLILEFEPRFATLEQQKTQEVGMLRSHAMVGRALVDEKLKHAIQAKGAWEHQAKSPQADPEIVAAHRAKQEALEKLRQTREDAGRGTRSLEAALQNAKTAFEQQEHKLNQLRRQHDEGKSQLQSLCLRQSPGEESLLYFLRTQRPDWVFDIAKVLREDLLIRTDLTPGLVTSLSPDPATLYGVALDLEGVDAHLAADENALRQEIEALEARLRAGVLDREAAETALAACNKSREVADQALHQHILTCQKLETRYQAGLEEEKAAKNQVERSKQSALSNASERLQQVEQEVRSFQQEIAGIDTQLAADEKAVEVKYGASRADLLKARDTRLADHESAKIEMDLNYQHKKSAMEQERDHRLKTEGVDTEALKRLDKDLAEIAGQLAQARESRNEVAQWQLWQKIEWPQRAEWLAAAQSMRNREAEKAKLRDILEKNWAARFACLQDELGRMDLEHKRLIDNAHIISQRIDSLKAYPPDGDILGQEYDSAWTVESLASFANQMQRAVQDVLKELRQEIGEIKKSFVARRATPPEQFYESHRLALGPEASDRAWIGPLRSWFASEHDQFQRTLKVEANQIAGAIIAFHRDMEEFHRKVQQFNRELQQSLDDNIGFDSISKVTVGIVSVIRELEFWPAIEHIAETNRAWLSLDGSDLPPPEFAVTLRNLLGHWEIREGIRAELSNLIRIQGEVVENGQSRVFRKAADLERVSSNGLSYLILCVIFIAFINRIRRQSKVEIVWALDELKDLDIGNIEVLLKMLERNAITLASAFPDPDADVLRLFQNRFNVEEGRRLLEVRVIGQDELEDDPANVREVADV
jgi:chromosome segregation ATPase